MEKIKKYKIIFISIAGIFTALFCFQVISFAALGDTGITSKLTLISQTSQPDQPQPPTAATPSLRLTSTPRGSAIFIVDSGKVLATVPLDNGQTLNVTHSGCVVGEIVANLASFAPQSIVLIRQAPNNIAELTSTDGQIDLTTLQLKGGIFFQNGQQYPLTQELMAQIQQQGANIPVFEVVYTEVGLKDNGDLDSAGLLEGLNVAEAVAEEYEKLGYSITQRYSWGSNVVSQYFDEPQGTRVAYLQEKFNLSDSEARRIAGMNELDARAELEKFLTFSQLDEMMANHPEWRFFMSDTDLSKQFLDNQNFIAVGSSTYGDTHSVVDDTPSTNFCFDPTIGFLRQLPQGYTQHGTSFALGPDALSMIPPFNQLTGAGVNLAFQLTAADGDKTFDPAATYQAGIQLLSLAPTAAQQPAAQGATPAPTSTINFTGELGGTDSHGFVEW
jgi:hypothetical protein